MKLNTKTVLKHIGYFLLGISSLGTLIGIILFLVFHAIWLYLSVCFLAGAICITILGTLMGYAIWEGGKDFIEFMWPDIKEKLKRFFKRS